MRRYSVVLGLGSSLIEIQKLAWFLEREIISQGLPNPLDLKFVPQRYGPYADRLRHLLEGMDGSFLRSEVRIADAKPLDEIFFVQGKKSEVIDYLSTDAEMYLGALEQATATIEGFESPLGLELLATVDWLLSQENRRPEVADIKEGLRRWRGGPGSAQRKLQLFDDRLIGIALGQLAPAIAAS